MPIIIYYSIQSFRPLYLQHDWHNFGSVYGKRLCRPTHYMYTSCMDTGCSMLSRIDKSEVDDEEENVTTLSD